VGDNWVNGYLQRDDYYRNVARGLVAGAEPFSSYGKRVTSGAESNIVWPDGPYLLPPAVGLQLSLVSTSAQDGVGGTGIRSVELHYLDADLAPQAEIVVLNGLTPVATAATDIRCVQCMHLYAYGSGKAAAGVISAANGGQTYAEIAVGASRCASSVRMVPAGKRLLVLGGIVGMTSGTGQKRGTIELATTQFAGHDYTADSVFVPVAEVALQDATVGLPLGMPAVFYEGAAVGFTFTADGAATVVGTWFGVLEEV
jgi:hypothetical protein